MVTTSDIIVSKRERIAKAQPSEAGSTERVGELNAMLLCVPRSVCLHRARAYTKVFSETEGEPRPIRFAKAFAKTLQDLPAVIAEGELIVGMPTCRTGAITFYPEFQVAWMRKEIDTLSRRESSPVQISPEQVDEVKEMLRYWQDRTIFDLWAKACPPEITAKVVNTGWADIADMWSTHGCHFCPPFEQVLNNGICSFEARTRDALDIIDQADPEHMGKNHFYQALLIVIAAIKDFTNKYSQKALELARHEPDEKRKSELLRIAETLERVPYHQARSFYEAIQAVSLLMTLCHIEGTGGAYTLGRIDQYLYPFYVADIEKGLLTPQQAQELIECLFIKVNQNLRLLPIESARRVPGYTPVQVISLGGIDSTGKDASNELSYLFLDAAASVRTIQPDIVLLWHPRETPYSLKMKAAEINALGLGIPKLFNTETTKTELVDIGYSVEEANVGWIHGCSEPWGPGCKQYGHVAGSLLNMLMALEAVFFNGRKRMPGQLGSGELLGEETGDVRQFASFDEFMQAVKTQIAREIRDGAIASGWAQWVKGRHFPLLLQSVFTDACIERGLPANAGGAKINVGPGIVISGGLATLADSLAAIKKLVFEEKKIRMEELLQAIDADFEGYETIRDILINQAPKFGNDIDYVDDLAREIFRFVNTEARKYISPLGNRNFANTVWPMSNVVQGSKVWATPDGRKAGTQLSNHVGPTDGMDVDGPTANINSVTKLDHDQQFGCIHNLYFMNIDNEEKMHNMVNLFDLFFSRGGHHIQVNCQDKEIFIDAQKHPERYRGLMVRVAGYVAYFVDLPKESQDQIIGRTSHYL